MAFSDSTAPGGGLNVARVNPWADLDLSLMVHPTTKDILPILDISAVRQAVKNLVLTNFYERPFQPFTGGNIRALLFEPASPFTVQAIRREITDLLDRHEPRVNSTVVDVTDMSDTNEYRITISFNIAAPINSTAEVNFYLRRLR